MTGLIPIGDVKVATDVTLAYEIRRAASQAQQAVDSRVQGVAADIIAADPTIRDAAETAVAGAAADGGFLTQQQVGAVRTLDVTQPVYQEVRLSKDFRILGGSLVAGGETGITPGYYDLPLGGVPGGVVNVTKDYRRAFPGTGPDGSYTTEQSDVILARGRELTAVANWSDSMGRDNGGLGTSVIRELGIALGVPAIDRGFSGDTPTQVAARYGAYPPRVTITDGVLPASGTVPVTISPERGWRGPRTWTGTMRTQEGALVDVRLVQDGTDQDGVPSWTLEQIDGSGAVTILPGARFTHRDSTDSAVVATPFMLWVGRNDPDVERGRAAVSALLAEMRDPHQRVIVLSMFNRESEPVGTPGYDAVMAFNEMLAEVAGPRYFDLRAPLISNGLALAGISPTPADTTAISEDRVPPSLMADHTHLNVPGRVAAARIIANEILGRTWS